MLRKCRGACSVVGRLPLRSPIDTGTVAQNGGIASKAGDRRSPQAREDQGSDRTLKRGNCAREPEPACVVMRRSGRGLIKKTAPTRSGFLVAASQKGVFG
jgi:hypothetical protein